MRSRETAGVNEIAVLVAFLFAVILGIVSPKIITTIVRMRVPTHDHLSVPNAVITRTETREEAAMFTRLFPMRIVDSMSSKCLTR